MIVYHATNSWLEIFMDQFDDRPGIVLLPKCRNLLAAGKWFVAHGLTLLPVLHTLQ